VRLNILVALAYLKKLKFEPSLVVIKVSEFRVPVLPTLEINVLHLEPGLLAVAQEEHLLGVVDHEDPLVS